MLNKLVIVEIRLYILFTYFNVIDKQLRLSQAAIIHEVIVSRYTAVVVAARISYERFGFNCGDLRQWKY